MVIELSVCSDFRRTLPAQLQDQRSATTDSVASLLSTSSAARFAAKVLPICETERHHQLDVPRFALAEFVRMRDVGVALRWSRSAQACTSMDAALHMAPARKEQVQASEPTTSSNSSG